MREFRPSYAMNIGTRAHVNLRVHEVEDPNEQMSLALVAPCNVFQSFYSHIIIRKGPEVHKMNRFGECSL